MSSIDLREHGKSYVCKTYTQNEFLLDYQGKKLHPVETREQSEELFGADGKLYSIYHCFRQMFFNITELPMLRFVFHCIFSSPERIN